MQRVAIVTDSGVKLVDCKCCSLYCGLNYLLDKWYFTLQHYNRVD